MNKIIIGLHVTKTDHERHEVWGCIDGTRYALCCRADDASVLDAAEPGMDVIVIGKLFSEDICDRNDCACNTSSFGSVCFIQCSEMRPVSHHSELVHNEVWAEGYSLTSLQKVTTCCDFFVGRIKLAGGGGYLSFSCGEQKQIPKGQRIQLYGKVKAKDYAKRVVCPCCRKTTVHRRPSLTIKCWTLE